jgi:hypothetical protein
MDGGGESDGGDAGTGNGFGASESGGEFGDGSGGFGANTGPGNEADANDPGFGGVNAAPGYSDAPASMSGFDAVESDKVTFSTKPVKDIFGFVAGFLPGGNLISKGLGMLPDSATYSRSEVAAGRGLGRGEGGDNYGSPSGVPGIFNKQNNAQVFFKRPSNTNYVNFDTPQKIQPSLSENLDNRLFIQAQPEKVVAKKDNFDNLALLAAALTLIGTFYG